MFNFNYIKKVLDSDGVIAFPTETVYGIGGRSVKSIDRIFKIKKRALDKPCALYFHDFNLIEHHIERSSLLENLIEAFWPGPLTIVVPTLDSFPYMNYQNTIGLRMPNLPEVLELLKEVGPFLGTSANISGEKPLCNAEEVFSIFGRDIDYIMPTTSFLLNIPSTVVAIKEEGIQILREGVITLEELQKICK